MVDSQALTQAQTVREAPSETEESTGLMAVPEFTCQAMYYGTCISSSSHITHLCSFRSEGVIELLGGNPRQIKDQLGAEEGVQDVYQGSTSMTMQ